MLRDAVSENGKRLIGEGMFEKYDRWPVYSKFFDNMGPIPHHMHQSQADANIGGPRGETRKLLFPAAV